MFSKKYNVLDKRTSLYATNIRDPANMPLVKDIHREQPAFDLKFKVRIIWFIKILYGMWWFISADIFQKVMAGCQWRTYFEMSNRI